MPIHDFEYLLPIFVGHPFAAAYTEELRAVIQRVCNLLNDEQQDSTKRFLWVPRFAHKLDHSNLETILATVREMIRQSALSLFEISDKTNANVFLELGIALGMDRSIALLGRTPYDPPADLRGFRGIEFSDWQNLEQKLQEVLRARLQELRRSPPLGQDVVYQKMQIDASWRYRIRWASKSMYFFAGDVSWATTLAADLHEAINKRKVVIQVCCKEPKKSEAFKWENLQMLKDVGVAIRLFDSTLDPKVRGFITEPTEPLESEAMFVGKETRAGGRQDFESTGVTIGESEYLYQAQLFRGKTHLKFVSAMVRLFDSIWEDGRVREYT